MRPLSPPRPDLLSQCRACGSARLELFLPMGHHPPATVFLRPEDRDAPRFVLNAQGCLDCGMIQTADQLPEGASPPLGRAAPGHIAQLAGIVQDKAGDGLIMGIGCQDGLLSELAARGARVLGLDPAGHSSGHGAAVQTAHFTPGSAADLRAAHGPAQVITAIHMLSGVGDLLGLMQGMRALLADDGWLILETPWALEMLRDTAFDRISHEEMSVPSLMALVRLAARCGMAVVDAARSDGPGGAMRVFIRPRAASDTPGDAVLDMLAQERAAKMTEARSFHDFADRVRGIGAELTMLLARLKADGAAIAAYGAPARGNTLLNFCQIGPDILDFLADPNALKQGLLSPGMQIPVRDPAEIARRKPDYLLVLAWSSFDEIRAGLADYEAAGGRFILPLPHAEVVL